MELIMALLLNNLAPNAIPVKQMAPAIMEVANKYSVDPVLLVRIIVVESRGLEHAYNSKTKDYGLCQINVNTASSMGIPKACLMNWRCNLDTAGRILSELKRHKHYRDCTYNLGPKGHLPKYSKACGVYERKLASI